MEKNQNPIPNVGNYDFSIYTAFLLPLCLQKFNCKQSKIKIIKPCYLVVAKLPNCVLEGNLSNINEKKTFELEPIFFCIKIETNSTSLYFTKKKINKKTKQEWTRFLKINMKRSLLPYYVVSINFWTKVYGSSKFITFLWCDEGQRLLNQVPTNT